MFYANLPGRGHYYTAKVAVLVSPIQMWVDYEKSVITGPLNNPFKITGADWRKLVDINRTFVTTTSDLYRDLDPAASYAVGDRVLIMEEWETQPPSRVDGTQGGPMLISLHCIGKWRGERNDNSFFSVNLT
jgi:hypothetical protein